MSVMMEPFAGSGLIRHIVAGRLRRKVSADRLTEDTVVELGGHMFVRHMRGSVFALTFVALFQGQAHALPDDTCPPPGWDTTRLEQLKASGFEIADSREREEFARAIMACLPSPDPFLRDGIAFEALTHMLRADQLGAGMRIEMARELVARLSAEPGDGFERPFAALVLSEVVRADMISAYLPSGLRDEIVSAATAFMRNVDDYRGFEEGAGWRHGVAHGADLLMQLARNPQVSSPEQLAAIRDAVGAQLAPSGHSYVFGEPDRLMRPIIMLAQRGHFSESDWSEWFQSISSPAPFAAWGDVFQSKAGLAKLHNLRAFLYATWTNAHLSESKGDDVLLAGAEAALRQIP